MVPELGRRLSRRVLELVGPGTRAFLEAVDEVREDPSTLATAFQQGKLILFLPPSFWEEEDAVQAELLRHEAGHLVLNHHGRRGERDPARWNLVCDAALHEVGVADPARIQRWRGMRGKPATFEVLGIPPMPPELAYELLRSGGGGSEEPGAPQGCGSASWSDHDARSIAREIVVSGQVARADPRWDPSRQAGTGPGLGRDIAEAAPLPPWIRAVLEFLRLGLVVPEGRRRSWLRDSRRAPGLLPGRTRRHDGSGTFLIDASGSMPDDVLGSVLRAVVSTPGLQASQAYVFDAEVRGPIPLSDFNRLRQALRSAGGGTSFQPPAQVRTGSVVWITDGYSSDGWPERYHPELWVIAPGGQAPPPDRRSIRWET